MCVLATENVAWNDQQVLSECRFNEFGTCSPGSFGKGVERAAGMRQVIIVPEPFVDAVAFSAIVVNRPLNVDVQCRGCGPLGWLGRADK